MDNKKDTFLPLLETVKFQEELIIIPFETKTKFSSGLLTYSKIFLQTT